MAAARQAVLADELRSFAVACSRARSRLVVTAVADLDNEPSPFVDLVVPPAPAAAPKAPAPAAQPYQPKPTDSLGLLVARLGANR